MAPWCIIFIMARVSQYHHHTYRSQPSELISIIYISGSIPLDLLDRYNGKCLHSQLVCPASVYLPISALLEHSNNCRYRLRMAAAAAAAADYEIAQWQQWSSSSSSIWISSITGGSDNTSSSTNGCVTIAQ